MEPRTAVLEPLDPLACADCGDALSESEVFCAISDDEVLCWSCTIARGGSYDAATDRWIVMPDVTSLLRERPTHRKHAG